MFLVTPNGFLDWTISYKVKWHKIRQAKSYSNINKKGNLSLWEKTFYPGGGGGGDRLGVAQAFCDP